MTATIIGILVFLAICWILLEMAMLEKGHVDRHEDGAQSEADVQRIIEASRPMPLEQERRHVSAKDYWSAK